MKLNARRFLSMLLCLCFCMGMAVPAFAANESNTEGFVFSASLDNSTLYVSDQPQTVVMTVLSNKEMTLQGIGGQITWSEGLTLTGISNDHAKIDYTGSINLANGKIAWQSNNLETLTDVMTVAVATFTVPANTPAGTYTVGMKEIELCKDNFRTIWESTATASATLTILAAPTGEGYTAGVNTLTTDIAVGGTVTVNVAVDHSIDNQFAAGEMVVNYDSSKLTYTGSNLDAGKVDSTTAGTLKIADYGDNKNVGTAVYTLNFTAKADGQAAVTLASAAFSDKEGAVGADLMTATVSPATVTLTIEKKVFQVTLPEHFTGAETVMDGGDYTFTLDENYTCDNVTATVNGETVTVTKNDDGSYTVKGATGDLVITGTAKPKTYQVSINGNTAQNDGNTATYGTDYTFTLPADVPAGTGTDGTTYSVTVTIGGNAYTPASNANRKYTIKGTDIKGDIVITVTATPVPAGQFSVTINGEDATVGAAVVAKNGTATLTLTPEAGYTYVVTATMGGNTANVVVGENNTYTVANVTGNVVFTVTKTLNTEKVTVSAYVTVQNGTAWLVKFETTLAEGKVPTYDGEKMFWSEKYNAYCYLVIASDLQVETAQGKVAVTDGTATNVDYGMDVNMTNKVDANDAQLAYDIYKALYSDFDTVSMEKFLRADVNLDGKVDTNDAVAVINKILNP